MRLALFASAFLAGMTAMAPSSTAAPDLPFTDPPLLYDTNGKLIGPYLDGGAYISIDGQVYRMPVIRAGILRVEFNVFYTGPGCTGDAYLPDDELVPRIWSSLDSIFYTVGTAQTASLRSRRLMHAGTCYDWTNTMVMKRMVRKKINALGFAFPVHVRPPAR